ncbi:fibroblast growth factor-binding protein 1-like [Paralichthys olivaceus]|uniref:fibroblast growth factor-binding protein 1-like n=1 Tax=Paralichthys olivaceus TaxID=8255 RepID=UPI00097CF22C|nr:PREDICTED: fibroblast growth factor-binding protein 1-like [Paralichthys olivaceus]
MMLLTTLAPWMLLAFLGHQVSLCSGAHKGAASGRGKFTLKNKMQCTWGARDLGQAVRLSVKCENPEARVTGGPTAMECKYNGKPQSCPGYHSDPKGFWKQVARAFKRLQGKVCIDQRALVKAGMCKRAPQEAHFKLDRSSSVASSQGGHPQTTTTRRPRTTSTTTTSTSTGQNCTRHRKAAEEYCNSSWASVCSFLFSMVQSDDC